MTFYKVFSQQASGSSEAWRGQIFPPLTEVKQRKEDVAFSQKITVLAPGPGLATGLPTGR